MNEWILVDCMPMVSDIAELPRHTVESETQLRQLLEDCRHRSPASVLELLSPTGDVLHMGIGMEYSGIRWIGKPLNSGKKQLKMAVADKQYSNTGAEFRCQGSESGFRAQYVIPVEKTIDAAIHYFKTGQLPDSLQWVEWDHDKHRLEDKGSL